MPFDYPFTQSPNRIPTNRDLVAADLAIEKTEPPQEEQMEEDRSPVESKIPNNPSAPMPESEY